MFQVTLFSLASLKITRCCIVIERLSEWKPVCALFSFSHLVLAVRKVGALPQQPVTALHLSQPLLHSRPHYC